MPLLNSSMDQVTNILQQRNGSAEQMLGSSRQMLLADRMVRRVQEVLQGGASAQAEPIAKLVSAAAPIADVKNAGNQASLDSQNVLLRANELSDQIGKLPYRRLFPNVWWGVLGAAGAVAFALLLVVTLVRDQRRRFQDSTELNQRNQEAIMRLLDEMGSLAEGDLTVKTPVTEDITGAIADSVNFAVEALRSLVTTINETSEQVSSSAQETQTTARHLADAAQSQAARISTATSALNQIASLMDTVSKDSAESADVAERSVQIASRGAEVVRETIL